MQYLSTIKVDNRNENNIENKLSKDEKEKKGKKTTTMK